MCGSSSVTDFSSRANMVQATISVVRVASDLFCQSTFV